MATAYKDDSVLKQRIELIDGKVFMMSPRPRYEHVTISSNIYFLFRMYLEGKSCKPFADGFDVYLDEKNKFFPDVMIVCNKDIIKHDGIHGTPDLIVEVLSPSTVKNDRGKKKHAYEKAGVKEYWLVNPFERDVEVYLNKNGAFILDRIYYYLTDEEIADNAALEDDDKYKLSSEIYTDIKVSIFDNLTIKLKDIFANIDLLG